MPGATTTTGQASGGNAKVFRIAPGGQAELLLSEPGQSDGRCQGCHSVSADGTRLIAQHGPTAEETYAQGTGSGPSISEGLSYELRADAKPMPLAGHPVGPNAAYGALYPDGSKFLSGAIPAFTSSADDPTLGLYQVGGVGHGGSAFFAPTALIPAALYDALDGHVTTNTGVQRRAAVLLAGQQRARVRADAGRVVYV
jgi:hypothetical protein